MTITRSRAALAGVSLVSLAVISACSGTSTTETQDGGALPTNTTRVVTTGTLPNTAECSTTLLGKASAAKFAEAKIENNICDLSWGIATILGPNAPKQGRVGFFRAGQGEWILVKDAATDADLKAEAPPEFPQALIDMWKGQYVDPTKPSTTTTTAGPGDDPGPDDGDGCNTDAGCKPTTTTAKPTTTTAKPTTTTARPTTTTGPPQTIIIRG